MSKIKRTLRLLTLLLLVVALTSVPAVRGQDQEDEEMMGMMGMMGMFMNLDVQVQTGPINLMDEPASIYVVTASGGAPVDVENMTIILWYDSPDNWTVTEPEIRGYWEMKNGDNTIDHGFGAIWEPDPFVDPDGEEHEIPGFYVATYDVGGFEAGDYLVWVYAEAPLNMTDMMGGIMEGGEFPEGMMGMMTSRGVGTCSFTVSETMTVGLHMVKEGFPELIECFRTMGLQMEMTMKDMEFVFRDMMNNTAIMNGNFQDILAFQEEMGGFIENMTTRMESMMKFMDDMIAFQEKMGGDIGDMTSFQEEMVNRFEEFKTSMKEFQQGLEASKTLMEDLKSDIATVKADVSETISALPVLHKEAREIQEITSAGVPISQLLSAIATVLSLISVILLVKLRRERAPSFKEGS